MGLDDASPRLRVSVVYSPRPGEIDEVVLSLAPGSTIDDALRVSDLQTRHPALALDTAPVGVWGALRERGDSLRDRDRVEVYRALNVDPKEARRRRHRAQVKSGR